MLKTPSKPKTTTNANKPENRTGYLKGSIFGPGSSKANYGKGQRFSNISFRTQHKG